MSVTWLPAADLLSHIDEEREKVLEDDRLRRLRLLGRDPAQLVFAADHEFSVITHAQGKGLRAECIPCGWVGREEDYSTASARRRWQQHAQRRRETW